MKKVYLIAVIIALVAGFATYMFANELRARTTIKDADTVKVIVAAKDIPKNTKISEDMFAEDAGWFASKTIVKADSAPNAATKKEELVDMITVDPVYAGEQVSTKRLQSADDNNVALSFKLPEGKVAYSIKAPNVQSVDGYISEGDTVNVLTTYKDPDTKESITKTAYKSLYVLRVSSNTDYTNASASGGTITSYSTLTLEVTEKQALELLELENTYDYKLVLNPREQP